MVNPPRTVRAILPTSSVKLTDDLPNEELVRDLEDRLRFGNLRPEDVRPPLVACVPGEGYFVNDGNHRVRAMKRAGVESFTADVYHLEDGQ